MLKKLKVMKYCEPCKCDLPEINRQQLFEIGKNYFDKKGIDITNRCRERYIVEARQMVMTIINRNSKKTLKAIGDLFGGYDHTTVINSRKVVKDLCDIDSDFKERFEELKKVMLS